MRSPKRTLSSVRNYFRFPEGCAGRDRATLVLFAAMCFLLLLIVGMVVTSGARATERTYVSLSQVEELASDSKLREAVLYPEPNTAKSEVLLFGYSGSPWAFDSSGGGLQKVAAALEAEDVFLRTTDRGEAAPAARGDVGGFSAWWIISGALLLVVVAAPAGWRRIVRGPAAEKPSAPVRGKGGDAAVASTRFADVAGANEAVADLAEMVEYLTAPEKFARLGARPPRGALLVGPPGTGKTLLARAVAGEAGVAFISAAGSDFVDTYVGVGAKRIRKLFAEARAAKKAIVFIDEIDAIGMKRDGGGGRSNREDNRTLIALLDELDGFTDRGNVIVIAATNRPDVLDPALTRPGRLERKVEVPNPDLRGREKILGVHTRGRTLAADVDLAEIAARTPGFSGAKLAAVVNEACLVGVRENSTEVTAAHFSSAVATIAMGRARTSAVVNPRDAEITAWHEAGHTVAAYLMPEADRPVAVSIVPRGPAGGVTWMAGTDAVFLSRRKAMSQLVVALAGRAGEEMLLDGEYTQGAHGDLSTATNLATAMITQYGMSDAGYAVRSDTSNTAVIEKVNKLLAEAHDEATALLAANRTFMVALATELLAVKDIGRARISEIAAAAGARLAGTADAVFTPDLVVAAPELVAAAELAPATATTSPATRGTRPRRVRDALRLPIPAGIPAGIPTRRRALDATSRDGG